MDVEPRQSGREGFTKPVRRAGAGHRVRSPRPARSGLPTVSAPLGFEAPARPDCLGSTRSNSSSSHRWHGCLAWRFSAALLAKRKILQGCYSRVPCTRANSDQSGHAAGWRGASLEDLLG